MSMLSIRDLTPEFHSELFANLPNASRNIHNSLNYVQFISKTFDEDIYLFYKYFADFVGFKFISKRKISNSSEIFGGGNDFFFDTVNPYGFSAPTIYPFSESNAKLFENSLQLHLLENNIISDTNLIEPGTEFEKYFQTLTNFDHISSGKRMVKIDLRQTREDLWAKINRGRKAHIKKAWRNGVNIIKAELNTFNINEFMRLHEATMMKHNANTRWRLRSDFAENLLNHLGQKNSSLYFAKIDDLVVSAHLVLHEGLGAYYFLGASDMDFDRFSPSSALMFETFLDLKNRNFQYYFLGGGVTSDENDNLFRFKSSFSDNIFHLIIRGKIIHEKTYVNLAKMMHAGSGSDTIMTPKIYFPEYRS